MIMKIIIFRKYLLEHGLVSIHVMSLKGECTREVLLPLHRDF